MAKTRSGLDTHDAASVTAWHRLAGDRPGMQRKTTKAAKARHTPEPRPGPGPVAAYLPLPPAVRRRWQGPSGPAQGYPAHLELASYGSSIC